MRYVTPLPPPEEALWVWAEVEEEFEPGKVHICSMMPFGHWFCVDEFSWLRKLFMHRRRRVTVFQFGHYKNYLCSVEHIMLLTNSSASTNTSTRSGSRTTFSPHRAPLPLGFVLPAMRPAALNYSFSISGRNAALSQRHRRANGND